MNTRLARVSFSHIILVALVVLGGLLVARSQAVPDQQTSFPVEWAKILSHMSIVYIDDGQGGQLETIRISGVNLQIVNGAGATENANGLGNVIVGYQETGNEREADVRTGSHYVVIGRRNNYTSYGGIVAGESNVSYGPYASVSGGRRNKAEGPWSSIAGGGYNSASATQAVVVGGAYNWSASDSTVVVGGEGNQVYPPGGGGAGNKAVVVGGYGNKSLGQGSVVVGGRNNEATANYSAILAGIDNRCVGNPNTGGGSHCAIVGGEHNVIPETAWSAVISGGCSRMVSGQCDWAAGGLFQDN